MVRAARLRSPGIACRKRDDLFAAEHYRQLLRLLGTDDAVECLGSAQRHAEKEPQGARYLVDVRPRPAKPGQVKLVGANLLDPQPIRRTAEETAELGDRVDVGLLGCWREVANRHVVDHAATQRGHLSHHGISCLMIGSGQPQSSQTGATSRQVHSPLAQAGSFNRSFDLVDDLLGHGIMEHVSNTRNRKENTRRRGYCRGQCLRLIPASTSRASRPGSTKSPNSSNDLSMRSAPKRQTKGSG